MIYFIIIFGLANDSHNEFIFRIMAIIHCNTTHSQSDMTWPCMWPVRFSHSRHSPAFASARLNTNRHNVICTAMVIRLHVSVVRIEIIMQKSKLELECEVNATVLTVLDN